MKKLIIVLGVLLGCTSKADVKVGDCYRLTDKALVEAGISPEDIVKVRSLGLGAVIIQDRNGHLLFMEYSNSSPGELYLVPKSDFLKASTKTKCPEQVVLYMNRKT